MEFAPAHLWEVAFMPKCVSIEKRFAECVINVLKKHGLLDVKHKITKQDNEVLIPIREVDEEALKAIFSKCNGQASFTIKECSPPKRKLTKVEDLPSFDIVGEVVIIRENALISRSISEVVEKIRLAHPKIRAIWVKRETTSAFRVPTLELLWGEELRDVITKEYGIKLKARLGHVYFNPRLAEEHYRVSKLVKDGEVVVDMFCGIGGFSIHIAARSLSLVIANDLNPVAYQLLLENIELNRGKIKGTIIPLNMDSVELSSVLRQESVDRIIADHPTESLSFVHEYNRLLKPHGVLNLYVLAKGEHEARAKVTAALSGWVVMGCREVLEHSPGTGIYRCDLIKPKNV